MERRRGARALALLLLSAASGWATCHFAPVGDGSLAAHLALQSLGLEILLAGVALAAACLAAGAPGARLGLGAGRLGRRGLALLVLGALAASHGIDGVLELTGLRARSALPGLDLALAGARGGTLLLALVGIGLAPGIAEELLFRGLVQRGLAQRMRPAAAIGVAALLFGAFHGEPIYAASTGVLGLYLGLAAHLAGSTRAAIVCHTANNLLAISVDALWPGLALASPASTALGFALAGACLWSASRRVPARGAEGSREDGGAPSTSAAL
jgi:membrane protease YdiL (CAAX protease family)